MLCVFFMKPKNKLSLILSDIEKTLENVGARSFTENRINNIIDSITIAKGILKGRKRYILNQLINDSIISVHTFYNKTNKAQKLYAWRTTDEYTIIAGLKTNAYFAYYSALFLHQLTLQIPKTVYLNYEHHPNESSYNILTQAAIDKVFAGNQRKSSNIFFFNNSSVVVTNGKYTDKLGIIKIKNHEQSFEYTDLERTLIDASIRPVYAGGIFEVLEAYKIAKSKLDVKKMAIYLDKLNYTYPYHQVIGFYLEKAGYSEIETEYFRKEINFDFYLTYNIKNKVYSPTWHLFYPKGL